MKNIKLLILFLMITSNFSFGQCEKKINDYIQMIKSMSCADVNNSNSQAMMNLDRVGKELANSCAMSFVQRGEEIKKATMDKVNSCGSNINTNSQSNNQSNNNNYNSTYNSNSSSNSQNSSGSVGTSSMNRGGNIVTGNSNSQNSNSQQEELARQQQEKIRLQQEKTNQEVEKANQQLAEINRKKEEAIRIAEISNQELYNKTLESTTNMINTTVANSISNASYQSSNNTVRNDNEITNVQEEFSKNNLSDKEIDSLLSNPNPNNYATINIYNELGKAGEWHIFINGKKVAKYEKKKAKIEYKIYNGDKLTIQLYGIGGLLKVTWPLKSFSSRIKKGKIYNFMIVKEGMYYGIEQIDEEPLDRKGKVIFEKINTISESDIEY